MFVQDIERIDGYWSSAICKIDANRVELAGVTRNSADLMKSSLNDRKSGGKIY
jgi:hypothetical protein